MRKPLSLLIVLTCLGSSRYAQAQPSEAPQSQTEIAAEVLFRRAVTLRKQGAWADACKQFRASQQMSPARGTLLNIAECDERFGDIASAWSNYVKLGDLAEAAGDGERLAIARRKIRELEPLLPRITVRLQRDAKLQGLRVTIDGVTVEPSLKGVSMPVDAGDHRIEATAPGYQPWHEIVLVSVRGSSVVEVPQLIRVPTPAREDSGDVVTPAVTDDAETATGHHASKWEAGVAVGIIWYQMGLLDVPSNLAFSAHGSYLVSAGAIELGLGVEASTSNIPWQDEGRTGDLRLSNLGGRLAARHSLTDKLAVLVAGGAGLRGYSKLAIGNPFTVDGSGSEGTLITAYLNASIGLDYTLVDSLLLRVTPLTLEYGSAPDNFRVEIKNVTSRRFSIGLAYHY